DLRRAFRAPETSTGAGATGARLVNVGDRSSGPEERAARVVARPESRPTARAGSRRRHTGRTCRAGRRPHAGAEPAAGTRRPAVEQRTRPQAADRPREAPRTRAARRTPARPRRRRTDT